MEKYMQLQKLYRLLFSQFLLKITQIDLMGLDYIYLRNPIHIERLEKKQIEVLEHLSKKMNEENVKQAELLIENTYKKVLAFGDEEEFQEVELFPSLYGEGNVPINAIVFVIAAEKENILWSLKVQLEPMLSVALEVPVKIFPEWT